MVWSAASHWLGKLACHSKFESPSLLKVLALAECKNSYFIRIFFVYCDELRYWLHLCHGCKHACTLGTVKGTEICYTISLKTSMLDQSCGAVVLTLMNWNVMWSNFFYFLFAQSVSCLLAEFVDESKEIPRLRPQTVVSGASPSQNNYTVTFITRSTWFNTTGCHTLMVRSV